MREITPEVMENNNQLLKASARLTVAAMSIEDFNKHTKSGIPIPLPKETVETIKSTLSHLPMAGHYIDPFTGTIHVGLTLVKEEYTKPIKHMLDGIVGVKIKFFKAKYTEKELRDMQKKIGELLWDDWKDGITETEVPLTSLGIDIKNNGLIVGFKELRTRYIEVIQKIVGKEVPIDFSIIGSMILNTKSRIDIHRPVF